MKQPINTDEVIRDNWVEVVRWSPEQGGEIYDVNRQDDVPVTLYRYERVPATGKALPKREKPFVHGSFRAQIPSGTLRRSYGYWVSTSTGPLGGVYAMPGGQLSGKMAYPMGSTTPKVAPAVLAYPPPYDADLRSQAEVKALNKLRGKSVEDSLNFGLVWAERHETVKLFSDASVGLLRLARALKAGRPGEAQDAVIEWFYRFTDINQLREKRYPRQWRQATKTTRDLFDRLSNAVLLWNLGLSPLIKDLQDAAQLLQTGLLTKDWDIKSVSKYSRVVQDVERQVFSDEFHTSVEQTFAETHGYTVTLIGRPLFTTRALLGQLGLTNLPNLAYQATRLTFILDYFYALGPWLEAIEVPSLFEFKDGSWTQHVSRVITWTMKQDAGRPVRGQCVLNYTNRRVYDSFPYPLPPLSLRERQLTDKQKLNTALIAVGEIRKLIGG